MPARPSSSGTANAVGTTTTEPAVAGKAAADTRAHGLAVEKEALAALKDKGVSVVECDKEAFRKRVLPQTDSFIKAHPDAKPVVDTIRATQA